MIKCSTTVKKEEFLRFFEAGDVLSSILIFRPFQPRCSYRIRSKWKKVYVQRTWREWEETEHEWLLFGVSCVNTVLTLNSFDYESGIYLLAVFTPDWAPTPHCYFVMFLYFCISVVLYYFHISVSKSVEISDQSRLPLKTVML